jgi:isopenicillin-N N-acyltransferase-like protein
MTGRSRWIGSLLSLLALACVAGCGGGSETPALTASPAHAEAGAEVAAFPFPIVELSGTSEQMGTQHGEQMGSTIRSLHNDYLVAYFSNQARRMLAMAAAASFEPRVAPEHLAEIRALAKSSRIPERQMLLAQCFLDLSPMTACSTVTLPASASPDGVARFGRNLDFPSFDIADEHTVVQIFRPADGRHAFMTVGWPGMAGVLSGMNEHGLTVANMEVTRGVRLPAAMPYVLLYRTVLERCRTTEEAIALLRKTPRQSPNNLMIMDAAGDRAVVELTPENVHVRRAPADEALVSTNHHRGDDCATAGRCSRFDLLIKASREQTGGIGVEQIQSMLADASQKGMTLQSMVFEPSNRVVYLSAGTDAAHRPFHRLDLAPYFAKDGSRVAEVKTE